MVRKKSKPIIRKSSPTNKKPFSGKICRQTSFEIMLGNLISEILNIVNLVGLLSALNVEKTS